MLQEEPSESIETSFFDEEEEECGRQLDALLLEHEEELHEAEREERGVSTENTLFKKRGVLLRQWTAGSLRGSKMIKQNESLTGIGNLSGNLNSRIEDHGEEEEK